MKTSDLILRQEGILDTNLLARAHLLFIGLGRSVTAATILASCGVLRFDLIEPQVVEGPNVGLSGYGRADIGKRKVHAAAERIHDVAEAADVRTHAAKAEDLPDLDRLLSASDIIKIGIDDPAAQFRLADRAQCLGGTAIVCGTTGDNKQFFAAVIRPNGPPLRALLPAAWQAVDAGFTPPAYYRSCRLNAERLNILSASLALGLIHHAAGSTLPIAEVGAAAMENPLFIGLNGVDPVASMLTPIRILAGSPG